jgi:FixJ family two-component response regulator
MSLIIIVDDDLRVRTSLENLLESAGYSTRSYASGGDLLDEGAWSEADCFLFDVRMKGLSGLQLQQRLAELGNRIPIIFLTAHTDDETWSRATVNGAYAFFGKPFDEDTLLDTLEIAVAQEKDK